MLKLQNGGDPIQNMENKIEEEKTAPLPNYTKIAKMQIQLAGMYNRKGDSEKAVDMVNEADKTLADPMCPETREKRRLQGQIAYLLGRGRGTSNIPQNARKMPLYLRFSGFIILLVGYAVIGLLNLEGILISTEFFDIAIFGVFGVSIVVSSMIRSNYIRKYKP
jgi:hypothetical protein